MVISIQALRKQQQQEEQALRQRELVQHRPVSGWLPLQAQPEPQSRQSILKFAQFLYDS
jgi:hypothetical protein